MKYLANLKDINICSLIPSFEYVNGNLKLKMIYSHTWYEQDVIDWTDTTSPVIAVQWMRFGSWEGDDQSYQVRNIRNPNKQKTMESCTNNVGSFFCSSLAEEYIGERARDRSS